MKSLLKSLKERVLNKCKHFSRTAHPAVVALVIVSLFVLSLLIIKSAIFVLFTAAKMYGDWVVWVFVFFLYVLSASVIIKGWRNGKNNFL